MTWNVHQKKLLLILEQAKHEIENESTKTSDSRKTILTCFRLLIEIETGSKK